MGRGEANKKILPSGSKTRVDLAPSGVGNLCIKHDFGEEMGNRLRRGLTTGNYTQSISMKREGRTMVLKEKKLCKTRRTETFMCAPYANNRKRKGKKNNTRENGKTLLVSVKNGGV